MIIVNHILTECVRSIQEINALKGALWDSLSGSAVEELFRSVVGNPLTGVFDRGDLDRLVGGASPGFVDSFFELHGSTSSFLTFEDFRVYLRKFVKLGHGRFEPASAPSIAAFRAVLAREARFFEAAEEQRAALCAHFHNEEELFSFLNFIFEEGSSSLRGGGKSLDLAKLNVTLRSRHGFPLLTHAEFSLLTTYFSLNCESGISSEEFSAAILARPARTRLSRAQLSSDFSKVLGLPLVSMNFAIRAEPLDVDIPKPRRIDAAPVKKMLRLAAAVGPENDVIFVDRSQVGPAERRRSAAGGGLPPIEAATGFSENRMVSNQLFLDQPADVQAPGLPELRPYFPELADLPISTPIDDVGIGRAGIENVDPVESVSSQHLSRLDSELQAVLGPYKY